MARLSPLLVTLALVAATACTSEPELSDPNLESSPEQALEVARAVWSANGSDNYDMRFNWLCFCVVDVVAERDIQVRDGAVVSGALTQSGVLADHQTVEGLFDLIGQAIDENAAKLEVEYHPTLGYPLQASIDYSLQVADEELGFTVHDLSLR